MARMLQGKPFGADRQQDTPQWKVLMEHHSLLSGLGGKGQHGSAGTGSPSSAPGWEGAGAQLQALPAGPSKADHSLLFTFLTHSFPFP